MAQTCQMPDTQWVIRKYLPLSSLFHLKHLANLLLPYTQSVPEVQVKDYWLSGQ